MCPRSARAAPPLLPTLTFGTLEPDSKGSPPLCVPDAPVYHPTEEQCLNPLEFIAKIRPEAERFGICKIVPPPSWKPPFMVDTDGFEFSTRIQIVSELQNKVSSTPEYKAWNTRYLDYLKSVGKTRKRNPTFSGREIELFKFHQLVEKRGGYKALCEAKGWRDVTRLLGVRPTARYPTASGGPSSAPASPPKRWSSMHTRHCARAGMGRRTQVTSGGSNLSYGIRSLYSKQFAAFDDWLARGSTQAAAEGGEEEAPGSGELRDADPEAQEAAAILESLMGTAAEQQSPAPAKRKSTSTAGEAPGKVCTARRGPAGARASPCAPFPAQGVCPAEEARQGRQEERQARRQPHSSQH